MSFRGESTRHTNVLPDCADHFRCPGPPHNSSVSLGKQWTSKQESSEMDQFTFSVSVGWLRAMRNRLDDANTSEACIIDFRSESNLNTPTGMLWKGVCLTLELCWTGNQHVCQSIRNHSNLWNIWQHIERNNARFDLQTGGLQSTKYLVPTQGRAHVSAGMNESSRE